MNRLPNNSTKFIAGTFIGLSILIGTLSFPSTGFGLPPRARKIIPVPPGIKLPPVDVTVLQKEAQELRTQRAQLEKDIDTSVVHIRSLKKDLRNADNPVTKYFYRRQLESQFAVFRDKVVRLDGVETRLSRTIRELGVRISHESGQIQPNIISPPPVAPSSLLRPLVLPPSNTNEVIPDAELLPPGFEQWSPAEKTRFIKQEITRISDERKQLQAELKQRQKDIDTLKQILDEINPPEDKAKTPTPKSN